MNKTKITLLGVLLTGMTLTQSCVKQRDDMEGQGQNLSDLLSIQEMHNKACTLTTKAANGETVKEDKAFSSAKNVPIIEQNKYNIRFLEKVDIAKTDCPFVEGSASSIELRGEPGKTYNMIYRVEQGQLALYKIVGADEVSHLEVPYSDKHHGKYYVPVAGLDIQSFFKIEKQRNGDNRETHVEMKVSVPSDRYNEASHFTVSKTGIKKFDNADKVDVLPIKYFEGEWYHSQTLVDMGQGASGIVGNLSAMDTSRQSATKIRFELSEEQLLAVNQNEDERIAEQANGLNKSYAVAIPAQKVDYRRKKNGSVLSFEEEELEDLRMNDAVYVELELGQTTTPSDKFNSLLQSIFGSMTLVDGREVQSIEVTNNYFSYLIKEGANKLVRYSFKRITENKNFKAKTYYRSDRNTFGLFSSSIKMIDDFRTARLEDIDNRFRINRFDLSKPIVYRFSRTTPRGKENEWMRDIGREAINLWQQAFERASGEKRNFIVLQEQCEKPDKEFGCDVPLGDIRYNALNLIDQSQSGIYGYGPSLADPETGEIITATSNITIFNLRESGYSQIRAYIARKLGYQTSFVSHSADTSLDKRFDKALDALSLSLIEQDGDVIKPVTAYQWADDSLQKGVEKKKIVSDSLFSELKHQKDINLSFNELAHLAQREQELLSKSMNIKMFDANGGSMSGTRRMDEFVGKLCPSVMNFVKTYKNAKSLPSTETENAAMAPCVQKYLNYAALKTAVHEIGHNLGLAHNFEGSYDKKNFISSKSFEFKYLNGDENKGESFGSSIMDYYHPYAFLGTYPTPGWYDIAALRFSYFDKLELESSAPGQGKTVKIPLDKSINEFKKDLKTSPREYGFCSDYHAYYKVSVSCEKHDEGTNHLEKAQSEIDSIYRVLEGHALRYDTTGVSYDLNFLSSFSTLRQIYEDWRILIQEEVGQSRKYLQGITPGEYEKIVTSLVSKNQKAMTLLKARNLITQFLVDIAFTPNKYCVVSDKTYGELFYELSDVRGGLKSSGYKGEVSSCSDPKVMKYFAEKGLKFKKEIGHFIESGRYSLDTSDIFTPWDFRGTALLRSNAHYFLLDRPRSFGGLAAREENFIPSLLDEPDLRAALGNLVGFRVLEGVIVSNEKFDIKKYSNTARTFKPDDILSRFETLSGKPNFRSELKLTEDLYRDFTDGLRVPDDIQESLQRMNPFRVIRTSNPRLYNGTADIHMIASGLYALSSSPKDFSYKVIDKIRELELKKELSVLIPGAATEIYNSLKPQIMSLDGDIDGITIKTLFEAYIASANEANSLPVSQERIDAIKRFKFLKAFIFLGVGKAINYNHKEVSDVINLIQQAKAEDKKLPTAVSKFLETQITDLDVQTVLAATAEQIERIVAESRILSDELEAHENLLIEILLM